MSVHWEKITPERHGVLTADERSALLSYGPQATPALRRFLHASPSHFYTWRELPGGVFYRPHGSAQGFIVGGIPGAPGVEMKS